MMAKLVASAPAGDWAYEIKFDGFRALALKDRSGPRLLSRNNKDLAKKFPDVAAAVSALPADAALLDGEIVALDERGRSSFQLLQAYELGEARPALHYYVFDLLHLDGEDLRALPLAERKARLETLLARPRDGSAGRSPDDEAAAPPDDLIRFSATLGDDAEALMGRAREAGLEGLVGKRADSRYETGRRSGAWVKLKLHHEQEFIIGGYSPPAGTRSHFGALLLGVREGEDIVFVGKVGTGFDQATLRALHARLQPLRRETCPFVNLPVPRGQRYGQGITAAQMKRQHWVKPTLVCQIRFAEWTRDGRLRQPVYLGLREDKPASAVVREHAAA